MRLIPGDGERAGRKRRAPLTAFLVVALAAGAYYLLRPPPREVAPGPAPEAAAPFGPIRRQDLSFRWAVPSDGELVRVEVVTAAGKIALASPLSGSGRWVPTRRETDSIPRGDLYWRPVAVAPSGEELPGDLAAFTLLP